MRRVWGRHGPAAARKGPGLSRVWRVPFIVRGEVMVGVWPLSLRLNEDGVAVFWRGGLEDFGWR